MGLGVVALVGEYGPDARHDGESGQKQPLEDERVVDIGGRGHAGDRDAGPVHGDMILGAPLGTIRRVWAGKVAPALGAHRAGVQDQVGVAAQHADQHGMDLCQHAGLGPMPQASAQGRATGLGGRGGQAAPRRALAQEPAQGRQHADGCGGRVTAPAMTRPPTRVDHRRNEMQNPDVQGRCPYLSLQTWAEQAGRSASQPKVVVKTASKCRQKPSRDCHKK